MRQFQSSGLLAEQLERELVIIGDDRSARAERARNDVIGFDLNISGLIRIMKEDPTFGVFDFLSKEENYKIDIGEILPRMEYEVFDSIRVSEQIPFAVMNLNKSKVEGVKGLYLATDRVYKIYHSKELKSVHEPFLEEWSHGNKTAIPYTVMFKILLHEPGEKISAKSYIDAIYIFEEGLFLKFRKSQATASSINKIISILRAHISGFQLTNPEFSSISGSFVMDRLHIDPVLFRGLLVMQHNFNLGLAMMYYPFLWVNERGNSKGNSLALRSQFILNFRLGDIQAKVSISRNVAKSNNIFYIGDKSVKFSPDSIYNQITISEVKSPEHALLVRDIVATVFYLYGKNDVAPVRSHQWAQLFNAFLEKEAYAGSGFGASKRISTPDIKSFKRNIMQLRLADPTFYGEIQAAKPISKEERQPIFVTSSNQSDESWKQTLWDTLQDIFTNDDPNQRRQIVRYPFTFANPPSEEWKQVPETKIEPYFIMTHPHYPFFKPKLTKDPRGRHKTIHPFLMSGSESPFIQVPTQNGQDEITSLFMALIDLNTPYQLSWIGTASASKGGYKISTMKILTYGVNGSIPSELNRVLRNTVLGKDVLPGGFPDVSFERKGSYKSQDSLLHCILERTIHKKELQAVYLSANAPEQKQEVVNRTRRTIADSINWNIGRQELYDMEPEAAKEFFLDATTPIDSIYFRGILEHFFNIILIIMVYENSETSVETPRHRFFHITSTYSSKSQPLIFFKHRGPEATKLPYYQYEYINVAYKQENMNFFQSGPWDSNAIKEFYKKAVSFVDTSFVTINRLTENVFQTGAVVKPNANIRPTLLHFFKKDTIKYQYIDGAGKMRAFVYNGVIPGYPNSELTIACEPLSPLDIDCFDNLTVMAGLSRTGQDPTRFLLPQSFDMAFQFVRSMGVKEEDMVYRLEPELLSFKKAAEVEVEPDQEDQVLLPEDKDTQPTLFETLFRTESERVKQSKIMRSILNKSAASQKPSSVADATRVRGTIVKQSGAKRVIGIWFKKVIKTPSAEYQVQFYIATEPTPPPTQIYAVDNTAFFDVEPEEILFRQHDYYEQIANIMVQLIRNLYIYSRLDDPDFFISRLTRIDSDVVYNIQGAKRRLPATRNFYEALRSYAQFYPSFFGNPTPDQIANDQIQLVFDSNDTKEAMLQHIRVVQRLKLDIMRASGSQAKASDQLGPSGEKQVGYKINHSFARLELTKKQKSNRRSPPNSNQKVSGQLPSGEVTNPKSGPFEYPNTLGLDDAAIEIIPRMNKFFHRPDYLLEFYTYPSDYTIRGPNQNVFLSEDEVKQYRDLLEMEDTSKVYDLPLSPDIQQKRSPVYFVGRDGSLYILQNVVGGSRSKAVNVLSAWDTERVNLGYFAEDFKGTSTHRVQEIMLRNLSLLDPDYQYMLLAYGRNFYAAILKLDGGVLFGR